jgi:hypothetical protein
MPDRCVGTQVEVRSKKSLNTSYESTSLFTIRSKFMVSVLDTRRSQVLNFIDF